MPCLACPTALHMLSLARGERPACLMAALSQRPCVPVPRPAYTQGILAIADSDYRFVYQVTRLRAHGWKDALRLPCGVEGSAAGQESAGACIARLRGLRPSLARLLRPLFGQGVHAAAAPRGARSVRACMHSTQGGATGRAVPWPGPLRRSPHATPLTLLRRLGSLTLTQGVHSVFEGVPDRKWRPDEKRCCKMVFIGDCRRAQRRAA